jgi:hypothetical protein
MSTFLQLFGVVAVIVGAFLITIPVGFITAGVLLATVGVAMERGADAQ